jgi:hypothetical protein
MLKLLKRGVDMKKIAVFFLGLFIFSFSVISTGCSQLQTVKNLKMKEPAVLEPKTEKFGNYTFVIPVNFELKEDLSVIYEDDGIYRGYVVFIGKASTNKLLRFFDKYMTKMGWRKDSVLVGGDAAIVAYSKGKQLIIFKIQEILGLTYIKTLLSCK